MRRRLLALACALALLAPGLPAASAAESSGPYEHVWQAEGQTGGDRGGRSRRVVSLNEMELALSGAGVLGHLSYADVLGVEAASGDVTGQSASIEVTLTGSPGEGGAVAAGTFSGQASLVTKEVGSLEGIEGVMAAASGILVVYEVSGHWGARISGGVATGELIYERATPQQSDAPGGPVSAEWFNRLGGGPQGGAQAFRVPVGRLVEEPAGGDAAPEEAASASAAVIPTADTGAPKYGPLGYVLRGITGRPGLPATPVSLSLSQRAQALKAAKPPGATLLPSDAVAMDVDVTGAYLDAKNRAAKLVDERGPAGRAGNLSLAWQTPQNTRLLRRRPSPKGLATALKAQASVPGATELASDLAAVAASPGEADEALLTVWASVIDAVGAKAPAASVLQATALAEAAVIDTVLPREGGAAEAVRAAALDAAAPETAVAVARFRRAASSDASGTTAGGLLPNRVLARNGAEGATPAALVFAASTGAVRLDPPVWPAYRRADGTEYWRAGTGSPYALTDGTLRGAGFTVPRAYLVDAKHVGRILAVYNLR